MHKPRQLQGYFRLPFPADTSFCKASLKMSRDDNMQPLEAYYCSVVRTFATDQCVDVTLSMATCVNNISCRPPR